MNSASTTGSSDPSADSALEQNLREMNERLMVSAVRQHELAEQALRGELYAQDIIATLREPFVVLNADLRVRSANRSFYDTFLVSKEETEERLVYDLGNGQWNIPGLRKLLDEVLTRHQSVHDYEVAHFFPSLGQKTMLLNARPFPPDSKNPELILLALEDVSELREQANQLAEANRHKDEFLAMLGHELRNPLAPIANAVQLLGLQQNEGQIQQKARTIIERQLGQLTRLIDDLLEVSRISTGRIHLQKERIGLNGILERALETVRPLMNQHHHELKVLLSPELIWLNADAARLEQVAVNLLTNAAKYTADGGQIWLTVQQEGDAAVLRVRDTGVGIAPELVPHIFDLFTQAERSLARSEGGLGIGLCLVQRMVEMHGGQVQVSSVPGQGSEFVVRLPVMTAPASPPPMIHPEAVKPIGPSMRVLVVDDNVDAAETLELLLKDSGHDVRTVHDGPTALDASLNYQPNVVLLDIGLPGMNGLEVAKKMREHPLLRNILLIAMTGYGQEADRQRSQAAGFDLHLVKPVSFGQVKQILAKLSERVT